MRNWSGEVEDSCCLVTSGDIEDSCCCLVIEDQNQFDGGLTCYIFSNPKILVPMQIPPQISITGKGAPRLTSSYLRLDSYW